MNEKQKRALFTTIGVGIGTIAVFTIYPQMRTVDFIAGTAISLCAITILALHFLKSKHGPSMAITGFALGGGACWFIAGMISIYLCIDQTNLPKEGSDTLHGNVASWGILFVPIIWAITGIAVHIQMPALASFIRRRLSRSGKKLESTGPIFGYLTLFTIFWSLFAGIVLSWLLLEHIGISVNILKPVTRRIIVGSISAAVPTLLAIAGAMRISGIW